MRRLVWVVLLVPLQAGWGQERAGIEPVGEYPPAISVLSLVLFPKVIADASELRNYVRGEQLTAVRRTEGDLRAVDALFRRALRLSWNNTWEALFLCTLASLDHRRVGVRVAGVTLWLPLTGEFEEEFDARMHGLPSRLYADTPPEGDRDKLQHFFGSALLAYMFESAGPAERVAEFVEWGEDLFVVGGANDARDMRADLQGMDFGLALLQDRAMLPSTFLMMKPRREGAPPPWENP